MKCCIIGCKSYAGHRNVLNGNKITFHVFPVEITLKKLWILSINRKDWTPSNYHRVCSLHFDEEDFIKTKKGYIRIREGAVPKLPHQAQRTTHHGKQWHYENYCYYVQLRSQGHDVTLDVLLTVVRYSLYRFQTLIQIPEPEPPNPGELQDFLVFNDSPAQRKLKEEIARLRILEKKRVTKIRSLGQSLRRLKLKMASRSDEECSSSCDDNQQRISSVKTMESLITELQRKNLLNEEDSDIFFSMDVNMKDIFMGRYVLKKSKKTVMKTFSPATRSFALTLLYYSPKAYKYVRKTFKTCLPHSRAIAQWYANRKGEPGFTKESFQVLKLKSEESNEKLLCSLSMGEMAIKKHIEWDGKKYHGYVDLGTNPSVNDNSQPASQVLVFLLVSLKERWKIPVGYFFVHSVTGEQRASLVQQCLYKCHESGVEVVSLTMDGCAANITMAKKLGCSFAPSNLITTFNHPCANNEVAILFDACHMLKLVRNAFEAKKVFVDYQGNEIKWSYLEALNKFQECEGLHSANKLKAAHLNFGQEKMKVKRASQLLCNSVADTLLASKTHDSRFSGVEATADFIRLINNLFDVFNSKSETQHEFKKPLCEQNIKKTEEFFKYANNCLLHLSAKNENTALVNTNIKTGFLGFITCIESSIHLYYKLVYEKKLNYLTMHKLSQNHLELFFGIIKAYGRTNNNPTARQFKEAYKNIVLKELKDSFNGKCIPLEDLHILNMSSIDKINATAGRYRMLEQDENIEDIERPISEENTLIEMDIMLNNASQNHWRRQVISYIGGYVVKSIAKKLKCETCLDALYASDYIDDHRLIKIKKNGALVFPSYDVINICIRTDCGIRHFEARDSEINKHKIISHTMKTFIGEKYFEMLNEHIKEQPPLYNHVMHLCKEICEKYINIRFRHIATSKNERVTKRQHLNKPILFTCD